MASIYDILVRLMGDGSGLREDLAKDKAAIDELKADVEELPLEKTVDIRADTEEAKLALDELDVKLEETRTEADLPLRFDDAEASAQLDWFKQQLIDMRAMNRLDLRLDDAEAQAQLEAFRLELDALIGKGLDLTLDSEEAQVVLTDLQERLYALKDEAEAIRLGIDDFAAQETLSYLEERLSTMPHTDGEPPAVLQIDTEEAQQRLDETVFTVERLHAAVEEPKALNIETTEAEAKLAALQDQMFVMQDVVKDIPVDVNDAEAVAKVDDLKIRLADLGAEIVTVKLSDFEAQAKIDDLMAKLAILRAEADGIGVGGGAGGGGGGAAGGAAGAAGAGAAGAGAALGPLLLGAAALGIGPALGPVLAGGAMGLASMFGAGLAGVGALAAVALPSLRAIMSPTAGQKLTPEEKALKSQLTAFKNEYHQFAAGFQTPVLKLFSSGLQLLMETLKQIGPVVHGAATAFTTLLNSADKALNQPFWHQFFHFLGGAAHSSILTFGETLGNLAKTFAGLMEAFQPFTKEMEKGLVHMTAGWAKWASTLKSNTEFQQFLAYVEQAGPAVIHALGAIVQLAMQLAQRLGPLSLTVVHLITDLGLMVRALLKSNTFLGLVVDTVLHAAQGLLELVDLVAKFITWLAKAHPRIMDVAEAIGLLKLAQIGLNIAMDANPIGLIIIGLTALGLAAYELIKHWKQVSSFFVNLWHTITTGFTHLVSEAVHWGENLINGVIKGIKNMFGSLGSTLATVGSMVANVATGGLFGVATNVAHMITGGGGSTTSTSHVTNHNHAHVTVHVHGASTDAKAVADAVLPHITRQLTHVARAGGISR